MKQTTIYFKELVLFKGAFVKRIKYECIDGVYLRDGFLVIHNCDDEWLSFNADNVLQIIERIID